MFPWLVANSTRSYYLLYSISVLTSGFDYLELFTAKLVKVYSLFHSTFVTSYLSS